ncbi:segregation/condensation protein A [bacterium]|nr:segregation/condensation protein A [bacterium]
MADIINEKESYRIRLSNFEGPLDLLLYLIRKEEIDIYDIPIASITQQYLEYVELMKELDLEVAGEFILMAATLLQIKVRMLLPRSTEDVEEEETDPRAELVRQLLEYRRFKEVAESLTDIEDRQRRLFPRSYFNWHKKCRNQETEIILKEVSLFDLLNAFKTAIDNMPEAAFHEVEEEMATIEEQMEFLETQLKATSQLSFMYIMKTLKNRVQVVVTFMAILEMIRTSRILVQQSEVFGEIWIIRREG